MADSTLDDLGDEYGGAISTASGRDRIYIEKQSETGAAQGSFITVGHLVDTCLIWEGEILTYDNDLLAYGD